MQPIPVLAAVLCRDGRYLLCLRPAHKRHGGLWEFPGGKLEEGESLEAAARRELDEELALELRACGRTLLSVADPGSPFLIHFVEVEALGEPVAHEHDELRWVDPDAMLELPLAPADRRCAERLAGS